MGVENDIGLQSPDLVMLCGILKVCELELVLLGKQGPKAHVDSLASEQAICFSGEVNFAFRGRFALPPGWCLFGYLHQTAQESWCHGTGLASGMAFTVFPEGVSEFMLSSGSRVTGVLVPQQRLVDAYLELNPHQPDVPTRAIALFSLSDDERARALRVKFEALRDRILHMHREVPAAELDPGELIEAHLAAALAARPDDRPACSRGRRTHYLAVQRAEEFMRRNLRRDIYLTELCNAAGVSERALRYAFDDLMGVSPNRYLSMLRLCTACKNLTLSDASRRSVKSVALSCGLWDLSRFADHYRRVFGERPRDTLMRSPPFEAA
ncbi:AraC family transcriptional regulator [Dyella japonica]|uniref:AraC family transcriptional regulator n=1 Tax=Dyella japonica A8 TaxID=1217721 RepID=A0A075JY99_9GAMM|nr:helix-turn-helix domain-containing protein [Dyella japonica]AIF46565.1 AraC family transcriptional regulator [Dyella japonica A8]